MNRREAFTAAMNHEDGAPLFVDFGKHIGSPHLTMYKKLKEYLHTLDFPEEERIIDRMAQTCCVDECLLKEFDVDFRWLTPDLTVGSEEVDDKHYKDMWGVLFQYTGDHWAIVGSPLADAEDEEDILAAHYPDPHNPALFAGLEEKAKDLYENTDYILGADGLKCGLLQTALQMRGYEDFMCDLMADEDFANALLDKLLEVQKEMWTEFLSRVGKYVQLVYLTDDYGTQDSLLISPDIFNRFIKPRNEELIRHIKSLADVKIMFHCDGSILPILDDMIEMGVDIINPVQTSTVSMKDTAMLKERFGSRLSFHGAIDVQQILPNASVSEIKEEVRKRVQDLWAGKGGYILAPCHNIGHDIEPEKLTAVFEAVKELRRS